MLLRLPTNRFVRHLLFWVLVCVCFLVLQGVMPLILFKTSSTDVSTYWVRDWGLFIGVQLPIMLSYSYGVTFILLPFVLHRQYGRFSLGLAVLVALIWILFSLLLLLTLVIPTLIHYPTRVYETGKQFFVHRPVLLDFIGSPFFRINIAAGLMVGIKLFNQWRQKQQESQQLEREKLQTELQLLKLQLNPDFLFSSLDQLAIMTLQKSKYAPEMVLKLAHLLRYALYESQAELVPLSQELDVIDHYIFLQRIIHPTNLEVSFTVRGAAEYQSIVPSSLFPIVENAFHQLPVEQADEPAWVSIDLAINETHLTLKVINGQAGTQTDCSKQLADIQKQLYFHYGDAHTFQILPEPDTFIVILTLPISTTVESGTITQTSILATS